MKTEFSQARRAISIGRALFATVGLRRVMAPEPLKISRREYDRAVNFEEDIHKTIAAFLAGTREDVPMPKIDYKEAAALLSKVTTPEMVEDNLAPFVGHVSGDDFLAAAGAAQDYVRRLVPGRHRQMLPGFEPRPLPPSKAELQVFARQVESAGNPLWAVRQLLTGTYGMDHARALQAVWPDVLQIARDAARILINDRVAKNPNWHLTRLQAWQLSVLFGASQFDKGFGAAVAQALAQEAKQAQAQKQQMKANATDDPEHTQTNVQRISAQ